MSRPVLCIRVAWLLPLFAVATVVQAQTPPASPAPAAAPATPASPAPAAPQQAAPTTPRQTAQPAAPASAPAAPQEPATAKVGTETPAVVIDGTADTLLGKSVRSPKGDDLGRIVDVIVDRSGIIRAAIIDFGGFLGVGTRKIAVDWRVLHFPKDGNLDNLIADLPADQVRRAPLYRSGEPVVVVGKMAAAPVAPPPPPKAVTAPAPARPTPSTTPAPATPVVAPAPQPAPSSPPSTPAAPSAPATPKKP